MNRRQILTCAPLPELTRREFMAVTGVLAATTTQTRSSKAATSDAVSCKLALKYHMIQTGNAPAEKLRIAANAGFDGVEVSVRELSMVSELRRAADVTGITIHGLTHGTDDQYEPALRMCKEVGGDAVLVIAKEHKELNYEQNFATAQKVIRKFLPLANQLGIRLLIENVRASFLKEAEEMARFIDSFDAPIVGAYFDTGNTISWTSQSAEHWARVLGSRIGKVDIKDRGHAQFGDAKQKRVGIAGTDGGEVHWENVRKELAKINFNGWATAEVAGGDEERLTAMTAWMRNVLRKPT